MIVSKNVKIIVLISYNKTFPTRMVLSINSNMK